MLLATWSSQLSVFKKCHAGLAALIPGQRHQGVDGCRSALESCLQDQLVHHILLGAEVLSHMRQKG